MKDMEVHKLRRQCETLANELRMYRNVIEGFHQGLKLDGLLKLLIQSVCEGMAFKRAGIFLLEPNRRDYFLAMGIDRQSHFEKNKVHGRLMPRPLGKNILEDILSGRRQYFFTNNSFRRISRPFKPQREGPVVNNAVVPIKSKQGRILGALAVDNMYCDRPISLEDLSLLMDYATQAGAAIQSFRAQEKVLHLSQTDPLTGLHNRRFFDRALRAELQRCQRMNYPLGLLLVDLDHFKRINDDLGHSVGDEVLKRFAALMRGKVEYPGILARVGGEEFALLLPEASPEQLQAAAQRLLETVRKTRFESFNPDKPWLHLTVSVGLADYRSGLATPLQIFKLADKSLYQAKRGGRDRLGTPQVISSLSGSPFLPMPGKPRRASLFHRIRHFGKN